MHFLKKIILLLLPILSFSCQTQLEKQGWQRIAIVSQLDTSTIKKDKELVVQKKYVGKSLYYYEFYISENDSTGQIVSREWSKGFYLNSDIAYYKWESDSLFVKLLNQGDIQASIKLSYTDGRNTLDILYEPKK
jgi:hypothetical protein